MRELISGTKVGGDGGRHTVPTFSLHLHTCAHPKYLIVSPIFQINYIHYLGMAMSLGTSNCCAVIGAPAVWLLLAARANEQSVELPPSHSSCRAHIWLCSGSPSLGPKTCRLLVTGTHAWFLLVGINDDSSLSSVRLWLAWASWLSGSS